MQRDCSSASLTVFLENKTSLLLGMTDDPSWQYQMPDDCSHVPSLRWPRAAKPIVLEIFTVGFQRCLDLQVKVDRCGLLFSHGAVSSKLQVHMLSHF
jgi:hypothetical protein